MESEIGAIEAAVMAFDGDGVFALFKQGDEGFEFEEFKFIEGVVLGDTGGIFPATFSDALSDGLFAIDVENEGIVVADRQPKFFGIGDIFQIEAATNVNAGVFVAHIFQDSFVIGITIAKASLAGFP